MFSFHLLMKLFLATLVLSIIDGLSPVLADSAPGPVVPNICDGKCRKRLHHRICGETRHLHWEKPDCFYCKDVAGVNFKHLCKELESDTNTGKPCLATSEDNFYAISEHGFPVCPCDDVNFAEAIENYYGEFTRIDSWHLCKDLD